MKLTVAALMFLVLLEVVYCAPYAQLYPQQYPPQGGQPIYTNTGARYPYNPSYGQNYYPNGGAQWPQQNWEYSRSNYMNQNQERLESSQESDPNAGFGFNILKGLVDVKGRTSLGDRKRNKNERMSSNTYTSDGSFYNPFEY